MEVDISQELQIVITCLQFSLFVSLAAIAIYKIVLSKNNNAKFLLLFYLFAFFDILVYSAMMIYQIVTFAIGEQTHLIVLIIINAYSMILESVLLFLLSFYWKQTQAMLRGSGLDSQQSVANVKNQLKFKAVVLMIWFVIYTTFLIYSVVTNNYLTQLIYQNIFYFGGQGISILLLIWSNLSQVFSAKNFSFTLKRYQSLVSYSMNKTKFRCIYWISTSINFIRLIYLITSTILVRVYQQSPEVQWLVFIIYTASAIIPSAIYLYSFQINTRKSDIIQSFSSSSQKSQKQKKGLYQPPQIKSPDRRKTQTNNNRESFNQTQLSNSYDSHGI